MSNTERPVEDRVETIMKAENILNNMATLSQQESEAIMLRFGIHGGKHTYKEIANKIGVCTATAHRRTNTALRKLRNIR